MGANGNHQSWGAKPGTARASSTHSLSRCLLSACPAACTVGGWWAAPVDKHENSSGEARGVGVSNVCVRKGNWLSPPFPLIPVSSPALLTWDWAQLPGLLSHRASDMVTPTGLHMVQAEFFFRTRVQMHSEGVSLLPWKLGLQIKQACSSCHRGNLITMGEETPVTEESRGKAPTTFLCSLPDPTLLWVCWLFLQAGFSHNGKRQ